MTTLMLYLSSHLKTENLVLTLKVITDNPQKAYYKPGLPNCSLSES